jgi:zinc transporter ZupT
LDRQSYIWTLLAAAFLAAVAGIVAGVLFSARRERVRVAIPLSAGLLLGVALFGLFPELARDLSIAISILCFATGFIVLTLADRLGASICPDCSHDHEHGHCASPLHGFAGPMLITCTLHASFDGWSLAASGLISSDGVRVALPLALVLHKIPEGLAIGGILKASMRSRWLAIGLAVAAELPTVFGGAIALTWGSRIGVKWTAYPLAMAGGAFLFFALHALHGEWKTNRTGMLRPGLIGLLLSVVIQAGLGAYFRI